MNNPLPSLAISMTVGPAKIGIGQRLNVEAGLMAGKLLHLLESSLPESSTALADAREFLRARAVDRSITFVADTVRERGGARESATARQPFDRVIDAFGLEDIEAQLIVLVGLAEEHEGFSAVFRAVHPRNEPWASVGLAARLLAPDAERDALRHTLVGGAASTRGLIRLTGDAPLYERSLCLADGLWSALHGIEQWPSGIELWPRVPKSAHGLQEWFEKPAARRAAAAVEKREAATILISGESDEALMWRGLALVAQANRRGVGIVCSPTADAQVQQLIQIHAIARNCVPVVLMPESDTPNAAGTSASMSLSSLPDAVVVCARSGNLRWNAPRALIGLTAEPLSADARRQMWEHLLPHMSEQANFLAARFPMEPAMADHIATDLRALERIEHRRANMEDFLGGLRARAALHLAGAIKLVKPTATWDDLVVSPARLEQLREAVNRLQHQMQVLDDWGFLKARTGSRGVRMLFAGPPGTGKTLSAEVMAHELSVDLLVVDLSRVVSKWIGETEKNLSTVFDSAERAQAVLFFDEADALFGKRTEVSDAHDRYANLETAYLLQRLERFDGLAILATNLRQNMDLAFTRRLEFAIEFDEPDREQRHRLWRTHIPPRAPLAADVNLFELAAMYPVTGGLVRNAAVSAAFLAATDGTEITRLHLVRAVRREYEKAGRAFPGVPVGMNVPT